MKMKTIALVLASMLFVSSAPGAASATISSRSIAPAKLLAFDPPVDNRVLQAFDNGSGSDVFFTQQVGSSTRLSRCSRTTTGKCIQRDSVMLPNYGHGESLEVFTQKGRIFAWVGSGAAMIPPFYPSRNITLVEYVKAPAGSKKASYRRVGTLTNLAALAPGKSGMSYSSAVATADGANRIALRMRSVASMSSTYYGIYKTDALIDRMKKSPGQRLSISKAVDLRVVGFKEPARPYNSFQGFDIKGVGANKKFLYLFGGDMGQTPMIYRYAYTNGGSVRHDRTYRMVGSGIGTNEAEGIKVEIDPSSGGKTRVQIGINPKSGDSSGRKTYRLYRFAE